MHNGWYLRLFCVFALAAGCGYGRLFSNCDVNQAGTTNIGDVQSMGQPSVGAVQPNNDPNSDGVG